MIWKNIIESFKNGVGGFSSRKLSTFWFILLSTCITWGTQLLCYLVLFKAVEVKDTTLSIVMETLKYFFVASLLMDAVCLGLLTTTAFISLVQVYKGSGKKDDPLQSTTKEI